MEPTRPSPSYRSTAEGTTRAALTLGQISTPSTLERVSDPAHLLQHMEQSVRLVPLLARLHPQPGEHPADNQHVIRCQQEDLPEGIYTYVCNLFAWLGARCINVLFSSSDNGVGQGDCVTMTALSGSSPSSLQPVPVVFFSDREYTRVQVQVAHHTTTLLQVPGLLSLTERRAGTTCRRSQRTSPAAASVSNYFQRPSKQTVSMSFYEIP